MQKTVLASSIAFLALHTVYLTIVGSHDPEKLISDMFSTASIYVYAVWITFSVFKMSVKKFSIGKKLAQLIHGTIFGEKTVLLQF